VAGTPTIQPYSIVRSANQEQIATKFLQEYFKPIQNKSVPTLWLGSPESPYFELIENGELKSLRPRKHDFDSEMHNNRFLPVIRQEQLLQQHSNTKTTKPSARRDLLELVSTTVLSKVRNYYRDPDLRKEAGMYLLYKLGASMGLPVAYQAVKPNRFIEQLHLHEEGSPDDVQGFNLVGLLPGKNWGTSRDEIVVIAAHWDTRPDTAGFNDNGAGVAAVLEVARMMTSSNERCDFPSKDGAARRPEHTVMFALFDLEEYGGQGSKEFVERILIKSIMDRFKQKRFGGALIVDTILNLNRTLGSQEVPENLASLDPEAAKSIREGGYRGDFLAAIQRPEDSRVYSIFEKHWNQKSKGLEKEDAYRLLPMVVNASLPMKSLTDKVFYVRSDHARFWFPQQSPEATMTSLDAIWLTDTCQYRGLMTECYHKPCDSFHHQKGQKFADFGFLAKTVETIYETVTELAKFEEC